MQDSFGRAIDYLRVSVTDRCNFRCRYCMPEEGITPLGHDDILTLEQIERVIKIAARAGIKKVRFTGGEPLVRKNIVSLIAKTAQIEGIEDIAMTTNGMLLPEMASELKQAGINRVNISLDTLSAAKFEYITRRKAYIQVRNSIEKALEYGFNPVKINTVAIKGFNDDEIGDFARLAYNYPLHVRFIEFMPIGSLPFYKKDRAISIKEVQKIVEHSYALTPAKDLKGAGPAQNYYLEGGQGTVGFIGAMSNHFCSSCNRLRLTADGKLRPCLYNKTEIDLKEHLNNCCSDDKLLELFNKAISLKPGSHQMEEGWGSSNIRKMSQIGG
jgi:cyclic pyranopterin phosphate synthase